MSVRQYPRCVRNIQRNEDSLRANRAADVVLNYTESGAKELAKLFEKMLNEDLVQKTEKVQFGMLAMPVGKLMKKTNRLC